MSKKCIQSECVLTFQFDFDAAVQALLGNTVNALKFFQQDVDQEGVSEMLKNWRHLCASNLVHIDYNAKSQLGVYATVDLEGGTGVPIGDMRRVFIGSRSHAKIQAGHKWSTIEDHAICGPFSMLNHACRKHANVDSNFESSDLFVLRPIKAMDELLVEYASEDYLQHHVPWIQCLQCIDGIVN